MKPEPNNPQKSLTVSFLKDSAFVLIVSATLLWLLISSPVIASPAADLTELPLEELMNICVVGASKYEQKIMDAPASVTIIGQDQIKKFGYRTLADILRSVRGFYVTDDHNYQYLGVRGFNRPGDYSTRILLLGYAHHSRTYYML